MGGGFGGSKSERSQRQSSFIDPSQAPFLDFLRTQGMNIARQQLAGGNGVTNPAQQAFADLIGGAGDQYTMQQIQQGQGLINRNLQENILPALQSSAVAAGQLGGSRGGVAAGIAARSAIESQQNLAENLLYEGQQRRLQALQMAPMVAGLQFAPLQNLAGLIGRPTVLSQGRGSGSSKGLEFS